MKAGGRHKAQVRLISSLVVRKGALLGPLCDNDLSPVTKEPAREGPQKTVFLTF